MAVVDRVIILWEIPGCCSNRCCSYTCWYPLGKCVCCYHGYTINGRCNKARANILKILTTLGTLLHITSTLISVQYLSLNYQTNCTDYVHFQWQFFCEMLCEMMCYGGKGSAVLPRATAMQLFERLQSKSRVINAQVCRLCQKARCFYGKHYVSFLVWHLGPAMSSHV